MPSPLQIPIIYENDNLLVLNKPSGIPSIPHHIDEKETAVGAALRHFPGLQSLASVSYKPLEPGLLHRLDTGTSGLLLFAKTLPEYQRMRELWRENKVQKIYRALIAPKAHPTPPEALCQAPLQVPMTIQISLAHDARSKRRMRVVLPGSRQSSLRGKPLTAITHILRLHPIPDLQKSSQAPLAMDVELQIKTGVMHQIRCHLAYLGWPVIGDTIYHGIPSSRLWLHAWKLVIPLTHKKLLKIQAPLPEEWGCDRLWL